MTTDEELRSVADALESSLRVVGFGPSGTAAVDGFERGSAPVAPESRGGTRSIGGHATAVAVDLGDVAAVGHGQVDGDLPGDLDAALRGNDGFTIVVASVPSRFDASAGEALDRLRTAGDAVVLVREGTLHAALAELFAIVGDAGVVNLDLADVRTLLSSGGVGALSWGSAPASTPNVAVSIALEELVSGVDVAAADGALVDVVGTPTLTVDESASLVDRVRSHVDRDAHVIWGAAVASDEPSSEDRVRVRLLVSGVEPPTPTPVPGDPCPRCGGVLSGYSMGDRTTAACDACGYAGVSRR